MGDYCSTTQVSIKQTQVLTCEFTFMHLNKTRLIMPNVGDINVGDQIKVLGNVFNGTYNADSVSI